MPNLQVSNFRKSIAFIDTRVDDYQSLVAGVKPGTEVVILDAGFDAIEQITEILAARNNIDSIHIISHGSPGSLQIGKTGFCEDNLETYSQQLRQWRSALTDSAEILLYGCNVASGHRDRPPVRRGFKHPYNSESRLKPTGENFNKYPNKQLNKQSSEWDLCFETGNEFPGGIGEQARDSDVGFDREFDRDFDFDGFAFIQRIAQLTNTNVAASKNLTGSAAKGGKWKLEAKTGEIKTPLVFEPEVLAAYEYVLPIEPYEIDLKTGSIVAPINQFITLLQPPTDSNGDSWLETLVKIDFQGLSSAKFIVDYGTTPSGWTVNIGDSESNNGFGGDGATQSNDAEIQIVNRGMAVFGNDYNTPSGAQIIQGNVPNLVGNGSRLELEISNQNLAWNNNNGLQNNLNSPYLFALDGQPDATGPVNYDIYAGFNRIIDGLYRTGSGVGKVTIILDPIEVNFGAPSYSDTEGTADKIVNIPVTIDSTPKVNVTVPISLNPTSSATPNSDYIFSPTTVTFPAGTANLTQNVAVTIKPDNIAENDETVIFNFGTIAGSIAGTIDRTTLTIPANGQISYAISADTSSIKEGNSGTTPLTFTVTRSGDIGAASSVNYAIGGTATNDSDYNKIGGTSGATGLTGTINFAADETSKTITLNLLGDAAVEADETVEVTLSNPVAPGIPPAITAATATTSIANDDKAGINVIPLNGNTSIAEGGVAGSYAVRLTSQPSAPVTISLNGGDRINSIAAITFDRNNWNVPQTISISAIDDDIVQGVISGTIAYAISSNDVNYNSLTITDVTIQIADNDRPGISLVQSGSSTEIAEGGATDTYSLVLTSEPVAPVTIDFNVGTQINPIAPVTFTANNWKVPQNITVSAIDDNLSEGTHSGTISHKISSSDANYNDVIIPNVTASIADNDRPGISLIQSAGSTEIGEGGATDTYSLVLASPPTAPVTINFDSGTQINPIAPVIFTASNWNVPQNITASAIDDSLSEGRHSGTIAHAISSTDANYNGLIIPPVTVAIADNDPAGVSISATNTTATEGGANGSYQIKLNSEPIAPVTISFNSGSLIDSIAAITFDSTNWNVAQTVTVIATDDNFAGGNGTSNIFHTITSADPAYNKIAIGSVAVAIKDNDIPPTPTPNPIPTPTPTPTPESTPTPAIISSPTPINEPQTAEIDCICRTILPPNLDRPNQINYIFYGIDRNFNRLGTSDNDAFYGGINPDIFNALTGNDNVFGGINNDSVNGNEGDDFIAGNRGADLLFGGKNSDTILGNEGADSILGNLGEDRINGREDNDAINGNQDSDWIDGGKGDDSVLGGKDSDLLTGSEGSDTLLGNISDDTVCGGAGDDYLRGDRDNDLIDGGVGDDLIYGGVNEDTLIGCDGNDILLGNRGDDWLNGGLGNDSLTGGNGVDRFLLFANAGNDTITDFEDGTDLLVLGNVTFSQLAIAETNGITQISFAATGQVFANLIGIPADRINAADFTIL